MFDFDYYRYYKELMEKHRVTFSSRDDLIDFVSMFVERQYTKFIVARHADDPWWDRRPDSSECPFTASCNAGCFLREKMAEMDTFVYKVKALFCKRCRKRIYFDPIYETELYERALKGLYQGNALHEVFPTDISFVIEGKTLRCFK